MTFVPIMGNCPVCHQDNTLPDFLTNPDTVTITATEYKQLKADAERWNTLCNLWLMCTELQLTQNEDGGYSIIPVEFVDNIIFDSLDGDTPEQAIDQAMAK